MPNELFLPLSGSTGASAAQIPIRGSKAALTAFAPTSLSAPVSPSAVASSAVSMGQYVTFPVAWGPFGGDPSVRVKATNLAITAPVAIFLVEQIADPVDNSTQYLVAGEMDTLAPGETRNEVFQVLPVSTMLLVAWHLGIDDADINAGGFSIPVEAYLR